MTGKVTTRDKAPVFVVGSARSGNTMLCHMLLSSGRFSIYRTEPCVFDLLVPRFGDFRNAATRRELMRWWVRTRQFRRSDLDAGEITEKIVVTCDHGGANSCAPSAFSAGLCGAPIVFFIFQPSNGRFRTLSSFTWFATDATWRVLWIGKS